MKYAVVNCHVYTGAQVFHGKGIIIDGDKIERLIDFENVPKDLDIIDLNGGNIAPGFIDLQVNGGGGYLFNDNPVEECVSAIFEAHKRFGTTNFLPTLVTTSKEKMLQAIETVKICMQNSKHGVLGLHFEGPYINQNKAGAHNKDYIRDFSVGEMNVLLNKGRGVIKVFTVAPEVIGESQIKMLRECDIKVSAGHTDATYEQAIEFFRSGASAATHLFNAMSQFCSRKPGVVGAVLDSEAVWAGIIADGFHVHFVLIKICKKIKGRKLILVTDAMPPVGVEISLFKLENSEVFLRSRQVHN